MNPEQIGQPVDHPVQLGKPVKRYVLAAAVTALVMLFGVVYVLSQNPSAQNGTRTGNMELTEEGMIGQNTPSPTPFPFQEMTIPYLRNRQYTSSLGGRSVAYQNGAYTAYLSSYDSDGLKVNGLLTVPAGEEPEGGWPAIVFVHGYIPPAIYATQGPYNDYVDYLARNGFVVFKIDLRGHARSEGEATGAYYSSDYIIDTLNARAALQSADFVNPARVGLWGHSMAGNVTFRSLAVRPDIPAAAIWGGAVYSYDDRLKYGIQDNSYRPPAQITQRTSQRQRLRDLYGEFDNNHPFWKQVAPTNYLNDIKGAVSLHHAVNDDVVNIGYSRDLAARLVKGGVIHFLHEYDSGGHNISGAAFNQAMADTVSFYQEYLK